MYKLLTTSNSHIIVRPRHVLKHVKETIAVLIIKVETERTNLWIGMDRNGNLNFGLLIIQAINPICCYLGYVK